MIASELRAALKTLGWSQADLARRMPPTAKTTVSKWATGKAPIPGTVAAYLRLAVKVKELGRELEEEPKL